MEDEIRARTSHLVIWDEKESRLTLVKFDQKVNW